MSNVVDAPDPGASILRELRLANAQVARVRIRLDAIEESRPVPQVEFDAAARKVKARAWLAIGLSVVVAASGVVGWLKWRSEGLRRDVFVEACQLVNLKAVEPLHNALITIRDGQTRPPAFPGLTPAQLQALEDARAEANRTVYGPGVDATYPIDCDALAG